MHYAKACNAKIEATTDTNLVQKHYTEVDLPRSANQTVFADSPDVYKHYCNTREEFFSNKISGCGNLLLLQHDELPPCEEVNRCRDHDELVTGH